MTLIRRFFKQLLERDEGVTAVEYAVMLAAIVLIAVGAIVNAGTAHRSFWLDTADQIEEITPTEGQL